MPKQNDPSVLDPVYGWESGERVVGAATVQLVSVATPCRGVWLGAPTVNHSVGEVNTSNILVGNVTAQKMTLTASDFKGFIFPVDDASKVYLKGFTAGDVCVYVILK